MQLYVAVAQIIALVSIENEPPLKFYLGKYLSINLANKLLAVFAFLGCILNIPSDVIPGFEPRLILRHPVFFIFLGILSVMALASGFGIVFNNFAVIQGLGAGPIRPARILESTISLSMEDARGKMGRFLPAAGFRRIEAGEATGSIFAVKGLLGIWGSPLLHIGFVVVLLGGLFSFAGARIENVEIKEGEVLDLPGGGPRVKLEKFNILHSKEEDQPAQYISQLLIQDKAGHVSRQDLKVNRPMKISGMKLFQMRYRYEIEGIDLQLFEKGRAVEKIAVPAGQNGKIAKTGEEVRILDLIPDFAIDSKGKVSSRTPYFRNPAVQVEITGDGQKSSKLWVFSDLFQHENNQPAGTGFTIDRIKKYYVSGILISKDPGVPVVYTGFVLLAIGALVSSFISPRQLVISPFPHESSILLQLASLKSIDAITLRREMSQLKQGLGLLT